MHQITKIHMRTRTRTRTHTSRVTNERPANVTVLPGAAKPRPFPLPAGAAAVESADLHRGLITVTTRLQGSYYTRVVPSIDVRACVVFICYLFFLLQCVTVCCVVLCVKCIGCSWGLLLFSERGVAN